MHRNPDIGSFCLKTCQWWDFCPERGKICSRIIATQAAHRKREFEKMQMTDAEAISFIDAKLKEVSFQVTTDEKHRTVFEASVDIPKLDEQQALLFVEEILNGKDDSY